MRRCRPEWQGGMHHGTFKATARREVIAGHVLERSEDERLLKVMRAARARMGACAWLRHATTSS